jgi:hypothetical protein
MAQAQQTCNEHTRYVSDVGNGTNTRKISGGRRTVRWIRAVNGTGIAGVQMVSRSSEDS